MPGMGNGYGTSNMGAGFSVPNQYAANPIGNLNRGPGIESFQRDGFKIMGKEPVKPKNDEGSREFAELFNLADSKIKDRTHEKPRFDLSYNPDFVS